MRAVQGHENYRITIFRAAKSAFSGMEEIGESINYVDRILGVLTTSPSVNKFTSQSYIVSLTFA